MTLRTDLRENRWLRARLAVLVLIAVWLPTMVALVASPVVALLPTAVLAAAGGVCWVGAHRTQEAHLAAKQREAADARALRTLRTLRAPDAGPDQCPVCGMGDLDELAADDEMMERGPGRCKVVPYGRRRAHRDCAEFVPYVPTEREREADTHRREHGNGRHESHCDWCFTEDIRWEREEAQREFERSWPELMEPAATGDRRIRLNRKPDPQFRHWLIHVGAPSRHMDILMVESCEKAPDGFGWTATLAEPLRHGFCVSQNLARRMMPMESGRLWNREQGRPFTRTELGLCDCGGPVTSGKVRASLFDAEVRAVDAKLRKAQADLAWLSADLKGWRD